MSIIYNLQQRNVCKYFPFLYAVPQKVDILIAVLNILYLFVISLGQRLYVGLSVYL